MIIVGCVGMMLSQDPPDPPDAVSKVGTSVQLNIWGYTFNQLSGSGIVGAINGSIGAFSYGNPALLNLHDKITMEFSGYDESMEEINLYFSLLQDRHIVPFSSFNIILPFKYKIGISYNNLYSWESGEMQDTQVYSPDGTGDYFTVSENLNNYSLSVSNNIKSLKHKIHYGLQLNYRKYINKFYTFVGKGYGISINSGLLIEMDDIQFGVAFETETNISIEYEGEGVVIDADDGETLQKKTNSFNTYLPAKLNLGFLILLTKKVESYFEYDRSYWSKISDYDYDTDNIEHSMGIRYSPNKKLAVTLGYYKTDNYWTDEIVNFGLIYKFKSFVFDLGYATAINDDKNQSFVKFSIAKHI